MAEVAARAPIPVVADESFRGPADLDRLLAARAAGAVNLKLTKLGGPLAALALARRARAEGLQLMAGAMVETRVGLLAMAHVVAALGGVDWVDLDTAFLLAHDPFEGGWQANGPGDPTAGRAGFGGPSDRGERLVDGAGVGLQIADESRNSLVGRISDRVPERNGPWMIDFDECSDALRAPGGE